MKRRKFMVALLESRRGGIAQGREPMPHDIESYLNTIFGSHRSMDAAREAIARADKVLARRLSERR
jgi:hypothetical protein